MAWNLVSFSCFEQVNPAASCILAGKRWVTKHGRGNNPNLDLGHHWAGSSRLYVHPVLISIGRIHECDRVDWILSNQDLTAQEDKIHGILNPMTWIKYACFFLKSVWYLWYFIKLWENQLLQKNSIGERFRCELPRNNIRSHQIYWWTSFMESFNMNLNMRSSDSCWWTEHWGVSYPNKEFNRAPVIPSPKCWRLSHSFSQLRME